MSVFVIAEAGVNHNGEMLTAIKLVDAAKAAGADAVKFQHFNSQALWGDDRIAKYELTDAEMVNLKWYCDEVGIEFMCTPFGVREVEFLAPILKRVKVSSGCLAKKDLLKAVAATKLPVILSTGMSDIEQVREAVHCLEPSYMTLLHCTSAYPCPIHHVNLMSMDVLRSEFGYPVGYSDHTQGITIAIAATARGATVIEKHLTLDRSMEGPDHKASIEPDEFRVMVSAIRTVEEALGNWEKKSQLSEYMTRKAWYGD